MPVEIVEKELSYKIVQAAYEAFVTACSNHQFWRASFASYTRRKHKTKRKIRVIRHFRV